MTMMRFLVPAEINAVGEDEVAVIMTTAALARDNHVLVPQGCRLANYLRNPIVLWSHNPDEPIGNAEKIVATAAQISARIRFAPMGISPKADQIRGLMKAGVVRAVSVGFDPIEMEPLDPRLPRGGQRISAWDLLELSAVSIPADTGAVVTARALDRDGKVLSSANADALREAHDHAAKCKSTLAAVLGDAGENRSARQRQLAALALRYGPLDQWQQRQIEMLGLAGAAEADIAGIRWNADPGHVQRQIEAIMLKALGSRSAGPTSAPPSRANRQAELDRLRAR